MAKLLSHPFRKRAEGCFTRTAMTAMVVLAMVVASCTTARRDYIIASDPCSSFREPFVQVKEAQAAQIREWAAIGAAVGGAIGTAVGAGSARSGRGALVGLLVGIAAGALVGAEIGYQRNLQDRAKTTEGLRLQTSVRADASEDLLVTDKLVDAVSQLNVCRLQSLEQVRANVTAGVVSKEIAAARLSDVRAAIDADNELINSTLDGIDRRNKIYVKALKDNGQQNAEQYLTRANNYRPVMVPAKLTTHVPAPDGGGPRAEQKGAQGAAIQPDGGVSIDRSKRPEGDEMQQSAYAAVELRTAQRAHVMTIEKSLSDTEALLLI